MKLIQIALGAVLLAFACASPSFAQLNVRDANGLVQRTCDVVDTTGWVHPCNVMEAIYGGQPIQLSAETDHSLDVTIKTSPGLTAAQLTAANLALHSDMLVLENLLTPLLQGGGYIGNPNFLSDALVVSGDQTFTVGTQQHATMDTNGRWKVGLSSARLLGTTASTYGDLVAGIDPSGNQQGLRLDGSYDLKTADVNSAPALAAAQTTATAQGASGTGIAQPSGGSGILGWLSGIYSTLANVGIKVFGAETAGSAPTGGGVRMMGSDGTYARDLTTDVNGRLAISPTNGSGSAGAPIYMQGAGSTTLMGSVEGNVAPGATSGTNTPLNFGGWSAVTSGVPSGTFDNVQVSPSGAMSVTQTKNSLFTDTTTTLGASSAFTGSAHVLPAWATYFTATFFADQASGTNGAEIDCSQDNSTWTIEATATLTASTPAILSVPAVCTYQRVKETNGVTAQTSVNRVYSSFTGG